MKKILLLPAVFCLAISLCSCNVNWFRETVDVPWYAIAIPVAILAVVGYIILMNMTFVCPHCGAEFKPKWYQLSVCFHINRSRLAKCPRCGKTSFCERKKRG